MSQFTKLRPDQIQTIQDAHDLLISLPNSYDIRTQLNHIVVSANCPEPKNLVSSLTLEDTQKLAGVVVALDAIGHHGDAQIIQEVLSSAVFSEFPQFQVKKEPTHEVKGLNRNKYLVRRTDQKDAPGGTHEGAEYFVLDLTHDPFAPVAMLMYAAACQLQYPDLTEDIFNRYPEKKIPQPTIGWIDDFMAPYYNHRKATISLQAFMANNKLKEKK